ncbi:N-acetylglucosaminyl-phosphatidylinositol de-N-acetylase-like isoform X1 [Populus alba x Populus x berolinensis]|nr:N-acetylglucosaminyl-phosphatidylinositol de-N-acetylase-like isoform X1 [Populus alba x Populus x berolinensis]
MGWSLVVLSLIVLWIASLWKVLFSSSSTSFSKTSFLSDDRALSKRNVLLVVAHPDDESMFFSPTINYLISRGHNLYILCFSIGNADGMGNTRKHEFYQLVPSSRWIKNMEHQRSMVSNLYFVPLQQVKVLDHPDLQDGFGKVWDHELLAKIIEEEVSSHCIDMIITFDNYGVSGHCNHRDVHYGVWVS